MNRNLKSLGLALAAVLVLSAVAASAASAAPKSTPVPESYPVTVKGSQVGSVVFEIEGTRKTECTTATFEGTIKNKAEAEESKMWVTPSFSGCTTTILGNQDPSTFTWNGCSLTTTFRETASGSIATEGWEVTGVAHWMCPTTNPGLPGEKTDETEDHVFTSFLKDEENSALCTYKISEQSPGGSVDYKLLEKDAEGAGTAGAIRSTVTGIAVTRSAGTVTNCGAATQTGKLTGEFKIEAFNSKSEMVKGKFED